MKQTQAFVDGKNGRTVLIALAEEPLPFYYVVLIEQDGGAYERHLVKITTGLASANNIAQRFLNGGE